MLDFVHRDTALECEPGVTRLFGEADIGSQGMVDGWAMPEEGHNWNDGLEAVYAIAVRPPVPRLQLVLSGEPYVTRARPIQELTLFGNGFRLAFWRMTARVETLLDVALEPEWWHIRGQVARMRLLLHLPLSVRPKEINDGQDGRELGFCCRSICLRPVPGWR